MDHIDRLHFLFTAWLDHCRKTPDHPAPKTEGGTATFDRNLGATYIRCCHCDWEHELPENVIEQAVKEWEEG